LGLPLDIAAAAQVTSAFESLDIITIATHFLIQVGESNIILSFLATPQASQARYCFSGDVQVDVHGASDVMCHVVSAILFCLKWVQTLRNDMLALPVQA
jgi:hypothetical protein